MNAPNPFAPPKAAVADMTGETDEFQPVKLWPPNGRIGRLRFLAYSMVLYFLTMVLAFVFGIFAGMAGGNGSTAGLIAMVPYFIASILLLILRSHDMDMSGWMSILAFIPFVGLYWLFKGGTRGANRFGAPPPPNGLGVRILGGILPFIFIVGIIAAVALPAYQQYTMRAKAAATR